MTTFAHLYEKKESFLLIGLVILGMVISRLFSSSVPQFNSGNLLILVLVAFVFFDVASLVSLKHHRHVPWQRIAQWIIVSGLGSILFYFGLKEKPLAALSAAVILAAVTLTEHDATSVLSILGILIALFVPFGASAAVLKIIISIGAGFFIGLIVFRFMRRMHSHLFSPLALVGAVLLPLVLAEQLGGNGVLAVTTLGVMFGTISLHKKPTTVYFMRVLSHASSLLLFLLAGLHIPLSFDARFAGVAAALFVGMFIIRYVAVVATPRHGPVLSRALVPPHAVALALLVLTPLSVLSFTPLLLALILLSNVLFLLVTPSKP